MSQNFWIGVNPGLETVCPDFIDLEENYRFK